MRVLSIQSFVSRGYVGNKCAVFALQIMGYDVDAINTVSLSNHTGYKVWRGEVMSGDQLFEIFSGLQDNGLLDSYTHLLTGYIRSASSLQRIHEIHTILKKLQPNLIFVCDPVMGDDGKLYVPEENVAIFRKLVLRADYLFPNQTEAQLLTNVEINSFSSAFEAIDQLHQGGARLVVITSTILMEDANENNDSSCIRLLGSWNNQENNNNNNNNNSNENSNERFELMVPRLDGRFTGTGDLFATLVLIWMYRLTNDVQEDQQQQQQQLQDLRRARHNDDNKKTLATSDAAIACELALASLQSILHDTVNHAQAQNIPNPNPPAPELRLIQNADKILHPKVQLRAHQLK